MTLSKEKQRKVLSSSALGKILLLLTCSFRSFQLPSNLQTSLHLPSAILWANLSLWPKDLAGIEQEKAHQRVQVGTENPIRLTSRWRSCTAGHERAHPWAESAAKSVWSGPGEQQWRGSAEAKLLNADCRSLGGCSLWGGHLQQWHRLLLWLKK